jgi:hypothetical protein
MLGIGRRYARRSFGINVYGKIPPADDIPVLSQVLGSSGEAIGRPCKKSRRQLVEDDIDAIGVAAEFGGGLCQLVVVIIVSGSYLAAYVKNPKLHNIAGLVEGTQRSLDFRKVAPWCLTFPLPGSMILIRSGVWHDSPSLTKSQLSAGWDFPII